MIRNQATQPIPLRLGGGCGRSLILERSHEDRRVDQAQDISANGDSEPTLTENRRNFYITFSYTSEAGKGAGRACAGACSQGGSGFAVGGASAAPLWLCGVA
jgi:hypothetical protein